MVVGQEVGLGPHERIMRRKGRVVMLFPLESKHWQWSSLTMMLKSFWVVRTWFWKT